jgi:hypothetical protein
VCSSDLWFGHLRLMPVEDSRTGGRVCYAVKHEPVPVPFVQAIGVQKSKSLSALRSCL